jgi:hypothetical protein
VFEKELLRIIWRLKKVTERRLKYIMTIFTICIVSSNIVRDIKSSSKWRVRCVVRIGEWELLRSITFKFLKITGQASFARILKYKYSK